MVFCYLQAFHSNYVCTNESFIYIGLNISNGGGYGNSSGCYGESHVIVDERITKMYEMSSTVAK